MILATGPSPLWYLSRGTGAIALVLLSTTVVLGITGTLRWRPGMRTPRFVVDGLHRNLSLLAVVLLAAHIVTALVDPFAHLHVIDAIVPLASHYRPVWLGLGALALDLLIAVVVTSLLRARLGPRAWRAVHWAAYACWPIAVLHGLGTGTDARSTWMQALTALCGAAVVTALAARLVRGSPELRIAGIGVTAAVATGIGVFALQGPFKPGWAGRAGTPAALLSAARTSLATSGRSGAPAQTAPPTLALPFAAAFEGTLRQSRPASDQGARVDVAARIRVAGAPLRLHLRLDGQPLPGGGLLMSSSSVRLGPAEQPSLYRGEVVALSGKRVVARLAAPRARPVQLRLTLMTTGNGAVNGTASAEQVRG